MEPIKLVDQINDFQTILSNNTKDITFLDTIGLVYHGVSRISASDDGWEKIYQEFLNDQNKQNKAGWPELIIIKNDFSKRIDVICSKSFIKSQNLLIILQRILFIEKYKLNYVYITYQYHPILLNKMGLGNITCIKKLSINDLFDLLKKCMTYYTKIYNDSDKIENILAKNILKQLN